jgi:hypothetical protein
LDFFSCFGPYLERRLREYFTEADCFLYASRQLPVGSPMMSCLINKNYVQYVFFIIVYYLCKYVQCATEVVDGGEKKEVERYPVAEFNFEHVSDVYAITLWILLGSLAKVGMSSRC